jgi:hypothetical protein
MCRKIGANKNVSDRVSNTEFGRIVLNFNTILIKICCILNLRLFLLQIL